MKAIIVLGILTGLDNIQVTPALGVLRMSTQRRCFLALMFGLCEALMPVVGLMIGRTVHRTFEGVGDKLGPTVLLACGATVLFMALRSQELTQIVSSRWTLIGLPLSLSLDNLLAGVGVGAIGAPLLLSGVVIGGISTAMSLLGLYAGHCLRRWIPGKPELLSGAYLMLLGLFGLIWNLPD